MGEDTSGTHNNRQQPYIGYTASSSYHGATSAALFPLLMSPTLIFPSFLSLTHVYVFILTHCFQSFGIGKKNPALTVHKQNFTELEERSHNEYTYWSNDVELTGYYYNCLLLLLLLLLLLQR